MPTLTQFRTSISNRLGLDNSVSGDQGFVDGWVNEGVAQVLMDTSCYVTSQTVTPGASQDYTLGATVLTIIEMFTTSTGTDYDLERKRVDEIIAMRRNNASTSGPTRYYALAGHNTIMFYPTPAAADTFTMYYVPVPTALVSGSDDPSSATLGGIPSQLHKAIEYWALSEAADANDDASSQQGVKYYQLYQEQIRKYRRFLKQRGGARQPRAVAHGPHSLFPNHSNSVYSSGSQQ